MSALEVLVQILPETRDEQLSALRFLVEMERREGVEAVPLRRLGALLPADPPMAEAVASRLRLSARQRKRLSCIAARLDSDAQSPHALAYHAGMDCAADRLLLGGSSLAPLRDWQVPLFPLKGGAIVARGVRAGPEVARIMQAVERRWIEEGFPEKSRVDQLLESELGD